MTRTTGMQAMVLVLALVFLSARGSDAETFVPAPIFEDPKVEVLTRAVAREWVDRNLLGSPYASVVIGNVDVYDRFPYLEAHYFLVVSDPTWNRLLVGEVGQGLSAYDGAAGAFGALKGPRGLATDADGRVYVADAENRRVVVFGTTSEFDRLSLVPLYTIDGFGRPYDVAHSDGGTPFDKADDRLYVADAGRNRIVRFELTERGADQAGVIGELGSGPGRFAGPMALTVGHRDGASTADLFVADAHNNRIVHLRDTGRDLEWVSIAHHKAGLVTSLSTDHWGNVYAAGPQGDASPAGQGSGGVMKYTSDLLPVAELSGGIVRPRSFDVPFVTVRDHRAGTVTRTGQGSGILIEEWTNESGVRLLELGVEVKDLVVTADDGVSARFTLTDRAETVAEIVDARSMRVIARRDLGPVDAGPQSVRFEAADLANAGGDEQILRLSARSTYADGAGDAAQAAFSFAGGSNGHGASRLALLGNEPNPFNPKTTIQFVVPDGAPQPYSVRVFDVGGRLVRTLAAGEIGPGRHAIDWDGRDDDGTGVGSGVYVYRLRVADEELADKMVLAK